MNYELDHIGIAVSDLDKAIENYKNNFSLKVELREVVKSQGVELVFLDTGNAKIELLAPTSASSSLQKFLSTRGPGLHHICYKVSDIRAELKRLKSLGHSLIDNEPRPGAAGSLIAFVHPKTLGGVLTELCEKKERDN